MIKMNYKKNIYILILNLIIHSSGTSAPTFSTYKSNSVHNEVGKYRLFELELRSPIYYDNPYIEVNLKAHFLSSDSSEYVVDGFWYGGNSWRVRFMPNVIGQWSFMTNSNDSSLDGVTGSFRCIDSEHPGILGVNPQYPYTFMLSEGSPFFWSGETCWYLMSSAVPFDGVFQEYINIRKEQKFNNIHFVLGTGGLPYGTANPQNEGGQLWVSRAEQQLNPTFFEWVDKRIAYMDSVQMGIGFYITWSQHFYTFTQGEFERFEKYLIARYSAYPLLYWVVCGEFDEIGEPDDYRYHGNIMKKTDPYGHLISIQPGHADPENVGTNRIFANENWLDYIMQQLPYHYSGKIFTPFEMNDYILVDRVYNKPVVDDEFGYEKQDYLGNVISGDLIRKYAWAIVFGGGFPSYGHTSVIRALEIDSTKSAGARYMTHLFNFFQEINWWEMNPANDKVDNGFCLQGPLSNYVVYLPDSGSVKVDLTNDSETLYIQWYNPKCGTYDPAAPINGGAFQYFHSPYFDDAVLYIREMIKPIIAVNQDSIVFEVLEGEITTHSQTITITNDGEGVLSWGAEEYPDKFWLNLENTTGIAGDVFNITINASGMDDGEYLGCIRVIASEASNSPLDIPLRLIVLPRPPKLIVSTTLVDFGTVNNSMNFTITNSGGDTLYWEIINNNRPGWIKSIEPVNGSVLENDNDIVQINVDRENLAEGIYKDEFVITSNGGDQTLMLMMTVVESPRLFVEPDSLNFGDLTDTLNFTVKNIGTGVLEWNAFTKSDINWLEVDVSEKHCLTTNEAQNVAVIVIRNNLVRGDYSGIIYVSSGQDTLDVMVTMKVIEHPEISVNPLILNFDSLTTDLMFTISNPGGDTLSWQAMEEPDESWISYVLPNNGQLPAKQQAKVAVVIDRSRLDIGEYSGNIAVISNGGDVRVTIFVQVSQWMTCRDQKNEIPEKLTLYPNFPNPCKFATNIALDLPFNATLKINIYNALGQQVNEIANSYYTAGHQLLIIDAVDALGSELPSGLYFYRMEVTPVSGMENKPITIINKMLLRK